MYWNLRKWVIITSTTMWLCQLFQGTLGPPGHSSGPPGLQKSGSNVGNPKHRFARSDMYRTCCMCIWLPKNWHWKKIMNFLKIIGRTKSVWFLPLKVDFTASDYKATVQLKIEGRQKCLVDQLLLCKIWWKTSSKRYLKYLLTPSIQYL